MPSSTGRSPVVVLTGPSGAGKGTMVKLLLDRLPRLQLAVSATTRQRRPGERDGVDYWFVSDEEFDRRLEQGELLEFHLFPWGQRSGTLRGELGRIAAAGRVPLLELEPDGSLAVAATTPEALTIFIDAPLPELERRLRARATESAGQIEERIALAATQRELAGLFDYVVENDDRARAGEECVSIVERALASGAATMPGT